MHQVFYKLPVELLVTAYIPQIHGLVWLVDGELYLIRRDALSLWIQSSPLRCLVGSLHWNSMIKDHSKFSTHDIVFNSKYIHVQNTVKQFIFTF